LFIGRKNEAGHIIRELQQGNNIILGGKYGIGRTSLVRHLASTFLNEWQIVFVDFSLTPGKMSEKLMKELGLKARFKKTGKKMGYKSMRYRISNFESSKGKQNVIVFDNIAKLTNQKIIFLRHLILENHFQFIAIVENSLSSNDLSCLKTLLLPANVLALRHLKTNDVVSFLRLYSSRHNLNWSDNYIHDLTVFTKGHPFSMIEMIRNKKGENK
jgi:replication-associated recombination protein RarA